jgi:hypothetical protein
VNALHVRPDDAFDLRRSDHYPRRFLLLTTGQIQHLPGEFFLSLQRQIGTQDLQARPYSFDTLACGKLDRWAYLRALAAVSTHSRECLIDNSENRHQGACGGFRCLLIARCDVAHRGAN